MRKQKESLERRWVSVNGMMLHVRAGAPPVPSNAPVLVLVHGLIVSSRYMRPTAQLLANEYQVYTPDLPGFGHSASPAHTLGLDELADTLAAWMDASGFAQAAFLGNSLGCQIIVNLALRHPDRIERAVLVGPTVDPHHRSIPQQASRLALVLMRERPTLVVPMLRDLWDAGLSRSLRTARNALMDPIEQKLPQVQVPTLVVRGTRDVLVPQSWAEEVTRLLPQGRLVVIPGGTHTINYTAPRELVRVMQPFLREAHNPLPRSDGCQTD